MRRYALVLLAVAVALLPASNASAYTGTYTPGAGINGTPHDLSINTNGINFVANPADGTGDPLAGTEPRICIFCHAPHNTYRLSAANGGLPGAGPQAPDAFDYLPLWNHELTGNYASYSMYYNGPGAPQSGPKASQAILNGMTPGSNSLLCLSCHDGSISVNSYGNASQLARSQSSGGPVIGAAYIIGQDNNLQNHHPIGFDYDNAQADDPEIRSADAATLGTAGFVRDHLYSSAASGSTASMECGTCHSVHNTGNTGETLLWRSDAASRLCLTCHIKGTDPGAAIP